MSHRFNAHEVLEMARAIERNGAGFYERAAEHCSTEEGKKLLVGLAAAEVQHEKTFAELQSSLDQQERESSTFDPDGMAGLYLQALADKSVFDVKTDPGEVIDVESTMTEIFRTALELEKDSICFYVGLKEAVTGEANKERVDEVIREEMRHVTTLRNEVTRLLTS
jgi:rubrerythrin